MLRGKSVVCVIPARLLSTRFPRKVLAPLKGKPLVQWAYEGACRCACFDQVVVAVDCQELVDAVEGFGGKAILTASSCQNGTERLVELQKRGALEGDIWVNWQGDEPFITSAMIETLLQSCDEEDEEIWTLKKKIDKDEGASAHVVKVVCDSKGRALYFSRSPIPHGGEEVYKHVGIYAYSFSALQKMQALGSCPLERAERLEQLRFLFHGLKIQVHETDKEILGIDTAQQLVLAEQFDLCYHS